MSTIRVSKVESAESPSNNIELTSSGIVVSGVTTATNIDVTSINSLNYPTAGPLSNRNLIINGAMQVAQRGTSGTSSNGNNNFVVDRFKGNVGTSPAVITQSQETTGAPDGFQNWLKVVVTTADTSIDAADYSTIYQHIEGYDFACANYGTSNAQEVTVSFKFKTNKAGTYCMIHRNNAADRNYIHEFTPVADGNWQTITYTVPGDITGTWEKTNLRGLRWELTIANGTAFQSPTVGSWFSGTYYHSSPNQVNFLDSTSNELGITGVQVELGSKATPFEHRPIGTELALCQRYFYRPDSARLMNMVFYLSNTAYGYLSFPTQMRASPTLAQSGNTDDWIFYHSGTPDTFTNFTANATRQVVELVIGAGISGNSGEGGFVRAASGTSYLFFDAEL
jgi:hypothetical protein